jgi:hypothetical protein
VQIDKARRDHKAGDVDHRLAVRTRVVDESPVRDEHVADLIAAGRWIDDAAANQADHVGNPLSK